MEILAIVLGLALALAASVLAALWMRLRGAEERAASLAGIHDEALRQLRADLDLERQRSEAAYGSASEALQQKAAAEARLDELQQRGLAFETLKTDMLQASTAAVAQTAQQVSSKLLDDHKREAEAQKADGEARVKKAADGLAQHMTKLAEAVAAVQGQVQDKGRTLDTVWRALTSPGGAGHFAEIGLANTLRSFGLEEGRDFVLQATTADAEGRRLRPDALVFLPGSALLVVDCKASKFLVEIAQAEGTEGEALAYQNLARTMNQHLKALAAKDYKGAIAAAWREAGRSGEAARILSVMYLPNEAALEKLGRADREFQPKAAVEQIIPAGPAGLAAIIGFAAVEIRVNRQIENQERIVETAGLLLDSVGGVVRHAAKVGRNIKDAASAFADLTGSVNKRLLPRGRQLMQLGLHPGKPLPPPLPLYEVAMAETDLIEAEPERPRPRLVGEVSAGD